MKNIEREEKNKIVKIKCRACDSIDQYHYYVTIYNSKNDIVYKGYASSKGIVEFEVPCSDMYKIIVKPDEQIFPKVDCKKILLIPCLSFYLCFAFYKFHHNCPHCITFKLTDKNYKGLPITKGEIILWPHHI